MNYYELKGKLLINNNDFFLKKACKMETDYVSDREIRTNRLTDRAVLCNVKFICNSGLLLLNSRN